MRSKIYEQLHGNYMLERKDNKQQITIKTINIMKRMKLLVMAATLVCGLTAVGYGLSSCEKANAQEDRSATEETLGSSKNPVQQVTSEELIRTSQSWDGVELPEYLQGRPELVAVKYVFPAGQKLGWHHHPVMRSALPLRLRRTTAC